MNDDEKHKGQIIVFAHVKCRNLKSMTLKNMDTLVNTL